MSSNNRSYSTNRFLSKTNPQFIRGLADSGSVLDSPEINKLAAQMVDLGIWGNLLFWVHEGLVKVNTSPPDEFVLKTYDITTNNRDFTPIRGNVKIENGFFKFTNSNDDVLGRLSTGITQTNHTYIYWINRTNAVFDRAFQAQMTSGPQIQLQHIDSNGLYSILITFPRLTTNGNWETNQICTLGTWFNIAITYNYSSTANDPIIYVNGSSVAITKITTPSGAFANINNFFIGNTPALPRSLDGYISDFRSFNSILTATEIDAIFQATRGKYGV
jgi:hypothetical protein